MKFKVLAAVLAAMISLTSTVFAAEDCSKLEGEAKAKCEADAAVAK